METARGTYEGTVFACAPQMDLSRNGPRIRHVRRDSCGDWLVLVGFFDDGPWRSIESQAWLESGKLGRGCGFFDARVGGVIGTAPLAGGSRGASFSG